MTTATSDYRYSEELAADAMQEAVAEYNSIVESGYDPFDEIMGMQHSLQVDLANRLPSFNVNPEEIQTKGDLIDWLNGNIDAIQDEFRELKTSVGGVDTHGEKGANAVWKRWKAKHGELQQEELDSMSPRDELEMKMEMLDIFFFTLNCFIGMGMSSREIFMLYYIKNRENLKRYESGY